MAESQNRTFSDQYMLRLPEGMRERLKGLAKANGRTMNVEIVLALESWLSLADHGREVAEAMRNDPPAPEGQALKVYIDIEAGVSVSMEEVIAQAEAVQEIVQEAAGLTAADYRVNVATPALAARETRKAQVVEAIQRSREAFLKWRSGRKARSHAR